MARTTRKFKPVLSLTEIARRTGLSLTTVSKIYNGRGRNKRRPSLNAARLLAEAQGITMDQLYKDLSRAS